jgi:predicted transcriptional regulator
MKTAISLPESLFERVDQLAQELNMPRSHIFVLAVDEFVRRHENRKLLAEINEAYGEIRDREEKLVREGMRRRHREAVKGRW